MNEKHNGNTGAMIASIIIVLLLLAGGYSAWKGSTVTPIQVPDDSPYSFQPTEAIAPPPSPPQESTEISDIEADAIALDMSSLDAGLENLDLLVN